MLGRGPYSIESTNWNRGCRKFGSSGSIANLAVVTSEVKQAS